MNGPRRERIRDPETLEEVIKDLALLTDGPFVRISFAFDGAIVTMHSRSHLVWHKNSMRGWQKTDARGRARALLRWIKKAAQEYRAAKDLPQAEPEIQEEAA